MKLDLSLKNYFAIFLIVFTLIAVVYAISILSPHGVDWRVAYYPAAQACLNGHSPYYKGSLLANPIWICLILAPFALFSEPVSRALFLLVSIAVYYIGFRSMEVPAKWTPLIFLSPQILYGLNLSSVDAFVFSAPAFHPVIGFVLALTKPQIGIGYAIYLLVEWIRTKDYRSLILALTISSAGILLSLMLGMPFSGRLIFAAWNTSLFPYSLPVGLIFLFLSLRDHDKNPSFIASPMMSPYVGFYSWAVLYLLKKPKPILIVFSVSWVVYFIWYFANV